MSVASCGGETTRAVGPKLEDPAAERLIDADIERHGDAATGQIAGLLRRCQSRAFT